MKIFNGRMISEFIILKSLILICIVQFVFTSHLFAQSAPISIDEKFDDWTTNLATYNDGKDNPGKLDLLNFQVTNDEKYLFIKFSLNTEISLTSDLIPHDIWLCIDTDNDPSTGFPHQFGYGSELAINFKEHYAWFNVPDPNVHVTFGNIGLKLAPTVTASTYELAIERDVLPDSVNHLFTGDTIRILIRDNMDKDKMPDDGKVFYYIFDNTPVKKFIPIDLNKKSTENIRVVTYNLYHNDGWESPSLPNIENVVKVLNGDIYCFQESKNTSASEAKTYMDKWLPLNNPDGWQIAKLGNIITCSKWPIKNSWNLWSKLATLIDLPESYPKDLLIINGHLAWGMQNENRQSQVDEFASFIIDAKTPGGKINLEKHTPFIFTGDMNLVGYAQQRQTVITGDIQDTVTYGQGGPLDWDSTNISDALPNHSDQRMVYSWHDLKGDGFPPGRLDYQFYSDFVLKKEKAFVLETEVMSNSRLAQYSLNKNDTKNISDHLPVVVDYSFIEPVNSKADNSIKTFEPYIYPNPTSDYICISSNGNLTSAVLFDLSGKKINELGKGQNILSVTNLTSGIYILNMIINNVSITRKVIILH